MEIKLLYCKCKPA